MKINLFYRDLELRIKEQADLKHQLKIKKRQLTLLMSKLLFPKGFSGKYPNVNIELKLNEDNQKAIDVMKKVIEEIPQKKKERNKKSNTSFKTAYKIKALKKKNKKKV